MGTNDWLFDVETPLGFRVHVTRRYWEIITTAKHPIMAGRVALVQHVLENPDEIRRSRKDTAVYLFYRQEMERRWVCAVTKQQGDRGFLITTYPTDAIKEGDRIWPM